MITDIICIDSDDALAFYQAFAIVSSINHVTIDKVSHFGNKAVFLTITISAIGASSFFALGTFTEKIK